MLDGGTSFRRGNKSNTANKTMNGRLSGSPESHRTSSTYFFERSATTPMRTPPANVRGMLLKAPSAAAPNAWTTRNVSTMAFRPMNGSTSTPESAANVEPMIQDVNRTRVGLVACIATRSGSSTTARMAIPVRAKRKSA